MKWLVPFFALPFLLIGGGLLLNRPPLLSPPGPVERIKTYLTTNVAETRLDHEFPELRPPLVPASVEQTRAIVLNAMRSLGWRDVQVTDREIAAVVVSPLFRFRDDVTVRLESRADGTLLNARSASRTGKGDLAANARHIRTLFDEVDRLFTAVAD
jgi:uncharacterized protein (DUF1499 family)